MFVSHHKSRNPSVRNQRVGRMPSTATLKIFYMIFFFFGKNKENIQCGRDLMVRKKKEKVRKELNRTQQVLYQREFKRADRAAGFGSAAE